MCKKRVSATYNNTKTFKLQEGWSLRSADDGSATAGGIVGRGRPRDGFGMYGVYSAFLDDLEF